jgi:crotonobetainyl-CoA:carnitine CoA-transferase CaiB-like acyl-CoA transferase
MKTPDKGQYSAAQPLAGLRVLDLTRVLAGPLTTMMLGDLGADVIKVERPGSGDESRSWGPPFDELGRSAYYLAVNRNKLSVALDFDAPADAAVLDGLIRDADVVVDNFLPGVLARKGLDPAEVLARHSRLVWCTITGFGMDSARPGYDFVVQAESGWMAVTGEPQGAPMKAGIALADIMAGKDAAIAILAALTGHRARGAGGDQSASRHLHVSLIDSARAALVNVAQNVLITGRDALRWGNAHVNLVPYQMFEAADRSVVIAVGSDSQWVRCARALGLDDLAGDPALATNAGRVIERERLVSQITSVVREMSAAEVTRRLDAAGVPSGVVRPVTEAISEVAASPLTGMPSSVAGVVRRPPPSLDQHGAVIRRYGWEAFNQ